MVSLAGVGRCGIVFHTKIERSTRPRLQRDDSKPFVSPERYIRFPSPDPLSSHLRPTTPNWTLTILTIPFRAAKPAARPRRNAADPKWRLPDAIETPAQSGVDLTLTNAERTEQSVGRQ
jgi:hypothetical protein